MESDRTPRRVLGQCRSLSVGKINYYHAEET